MMRHLRLVFALGVLMHAACTPSPGPITVAENVVSIQNQTPRDWQNVVVTVNDHFRRGAPRLPAGGRMSAPLSQFETAFGQRYDVSRQHVFKIEVTATESDGSPVTLEFDPLRR